MKIYLREVVAGAIRKQVPLSVTKKKAGMAEHPLVFDHAGLLVNGPPGTAGLPFI
jgi:hypothetical protein